MHTGILTITRPTPHASTTPQTREILAARARLEQLLPLADLAHNAAQSAGIRTLRHPQGVACGQAALRVRELLKDPGATLEVLTAAGDTLQAATEALQQATLGYTNEVRVINAAERPRIGPVPRNHMDPDAWLATINTGFRARLLSRFEEEAQRWPTAGEVTHAVRERCLRDGERGAEAGEWLWLGQSISSNSVAARKVAARYLPAGG